MRQLKMETAWLGPKMSLLITAESFSISMIESSLQKPFLKFILVFAVV